jgi:hypothetical protein
MEIFNSPGPVNGLEPDLTFEAYCLANAMNNTRMKLASKSLWRLKQVLDHPERDTFDTETLMQGRQFHSLLLEPDHFYHRYAVLDDATKERILQADQERVEKENEERTKSNQLTFPKVFRRGTPCHKAWQKENADVGREEVDAEWFVRMDEMARAIRDYDEVWKLIEGSQTEVTAFGCFESGVAGEGAQWSMQLKARFDMLRPETDYILDLKTARSITEDDFGRQVSNLGYHKAAAFYTDVARLAGLDKRRFGFLVVEKEWPFDCTIHWLPDEWLKLGRQEYRADLYRIANAFQTGEWARIPVSEIMPPPWLQTVLEQI